MKSGVNAAVLGSHWDILHSSQLGGLYDENRILIINALLKA